MGVAGCGKSSVGAALAARLGLPFADGDDLHPAANIAKMTRGEALTDADRWPWLTAVGTALRDRPGLIGCSALRRAYRDHITAEAGHPVTFLHLSGSRAVIEARMRARTGHFMPPSLLDSQFATLEPPGPDENAVTVDIDQPIDAIVAALLARIAP
jgi:gluconokinase